MKIEKLGCKTVPFPSVFKEGWLRLNKKSPFKSGADGVVSNFKQNKERFASICKEAARFFSNHPVCAAKEREYARS